MAGTGARGQNGMSLIEVMIASSLLTTVMLGLAQAMSWSNLSLRGQEERGRFERRVARIAQVLSRPDACLGQTNLREIFREIRSGDQIPKLEAGMTLDGGDAEARKLPFFSDARADLRFVARTPRGERVERLVGPDPEDPQGTREKTDGIRLSSFRFELPLTRWDERSYSTRLLVYGERVARAGAARSLGAPEFKPVEYWLNFTLSEDPNQGIESCSLAMAEARGPEPLPDCGDRGSPSLVWNPAAHAWECGPDERPSITLCTPGPCPATDRTQGETP